MSFFFHSQTIQQIKQKKKKIKFKLLKTRTKFLKTVTKVLKKEVVMEIMFENYSKKENAIN